MSAADSSSSGEHRAARVGLLAGFALAALLVLALLVRYPGDTDTRAAYLGGGGAAILVLLVTGWATSRGTRTRSAEATLALRRGPPQASR